MIRRMILPFIGLVTITLTTSCAGESKKALFEEKLPYYGLNQALDSLEIIEKGNRDVHVFDGNGYLKERRKYGENGVLAELDEYQRDENGQLKSYQTAYNLYDPHYIVESAYELLSRDKNMEVWATGDDWWGTSYDTIYYAKDMITTTSYVKKKKTDEISFSFQNIKYFDDMGRLTKEESFRSQDNISYEEYYYEDQHLSKKTEGRILEGEKRGDTTRFYSILEQDENKNPTHVKIEREDGGGNHTKENNVKYYYKVK